MSNGGTFSRSKSSYLWPLITSLIGVYLLFTEEFGAWQNRDPFYGVTEGYVWIGSTKVAPWSQIGITLLSVGLLYVAYVSYRGYQDHSTLSDKLVRNAYYSALAVTGLSIIFGLIFVALVWDSEWWWFGGGFYGALLGGGLTAYTYRKNMR